MHRAHNGTTALEITDLYMGGGRGVRNNCGDFTCTGGNGGLGRLRSQLERRPADPIPTNDRPTLNLPQMIDSDEGADVVFTISASDPNADPIGFEATGLPVGLTLDPQTGVISGSLGYDTSGSYAVTITVTDDLGASRTRETTWRVFDVNRPPTLVDPGPRTNSENQTVQVNLQGADPDGDALTYSVSGLPSGLSVNSDTGAIRGRLTYDSAGVHTVTATVRDARNAVAQRTFSWTVNDVNRLPQLSPIFDQSDAEGDLIVLRIDGADPDGDTLRYTATGLPPGLGVSYVFTATAIDGRLPYDAAGHYEVTVTVSDGRGGRDSETFDWDVEDTNRDPTLRNPGDQAAAEGETVSLQLDANDPDDDPVTFAATGLPGGLRVGRDTGRIAGTVGFNAEVNSPYQVRVTASDGRGGTDVASFRWVIGGTNRPPEVTSPGTQTSAEGDTVRLEVESRDRDGDDVTYAADGLPPDLEIGANDGVIAGVLTFEAAGRHTVTVRVSDGELNGSQTFDWVVSETNRPPTIDAEDVTSAEGAAVHISTVEAADPDGDPLRFSADGLPPGISVNPDTAAFTGATSFDGAGEYTVRVTVSDGDLTADATLTWSVTNTNRAPILDSPGDQSGGEGDEIGVTLTAVDPDGDQIRFAATGLPAGLDINPVSGLISGRIAFDTEGEHPVVLEVSDGEGAATQTFTFTVRHTNRAPTADAGGPYEVAEGAELTLIGAGDDPDGDEISFDWDLDGDGVFGDAQGPTPTITAPNGDDSFVVALRVADGTDASVATTRLDTINVAPVIGDLTSDPESVLESAAVTFTVPLSDAGADRLEVRWNFGDETEPAEGEAPGHRYRDTGSYVVTVTADDGDGGITSRVFAVEVGDVAPAFNGLAGPVRVDEGTTLTVQAELTKAWADAATWALEWGDGESTTGAVGPGVVSQIVAGDHVYTDEGTYVANLSAVDDDGSLVSAEHTIEVVNVAPTIVSEPPLLAVLGRPYRYHVEVDDPGDDTMTYAVTSGPPGMAFDGATLTWDLTPADLNRSPIPVAIRVDDGDGGEALQDWEIATTFADEDMDGVPDACEEMYGLDPQDPDDGDLDNDADGRTNREECLSRDDPTSYDGPSAPVPVAPEDWARLDSVDVTLVVANAEDPDGDSLTYEFELYAEADLQDLVASVETLAEGDEMTQWTLEGLDDNRSHWWRARAADPYVAGPWSDPVRFLVDLENEAPGVPSPVAPTGSADTATPTFTVDAVRDPEGDPVEYQFQVFGDADLTMLVTAGTSDDTQWVPGEALIEDRMYWWRASAADALGAQSAASGPLEFLVNAENALPVAPKIVAPRQGEAHEPGPFTFKWEPVEDAEGEPVTYEHELGADATFARVVSSGSGEDLGVTETLEVGDYAFRVRAWDPHGAGPYAVVALTVAEANTPPTAPTLLSPGADDEVLLAAGGIDLTLEGAADPDGDRVTYTVIVFAEDGEPVWSMADVVPESAAPTSVRWSPGGEGTYMWTARAADVHGAAGPEALPVTFHVIQPAVASRGDDSSCGVSGWSRAVLQFRRR